MTFRFGIMFDFRNPAPWRQDWTERYAQLFELLDWIEGTPAFSEITISEHHFLDDGYLPSTMVMAAAMAQRTRRLRISTGVLPLPLHNPVRVAEDALTVDAMSGGRFRLGLGSGYRGDEFQALGASLRDRKSRMEDGLAILRGAFSGAPFAFEGKHWSFPTLSISPPPIRRGGPPIWMSGSAPAAIDRAARLADGFFATTNEQVVAYLQACERHGVPAERRQTARTIIAIVAEDPEKALADLGPHVVYQINEYIKYGFIDLPPFGEADSIVEAGLFPIVDAAGALAMLDEAKDAGVEEVHFLGTLPGEPLDSATARHDYVAQRVIPAFRGTDTAHRPGPDRP